MMVAVQVIAVEAIEAGGVGWWHLRSIPALLRVGAGPLLFPPAINS